MAPDVPSGEFIRKARGARPQNGLMIIYPIDPEKALVEQTDRPVIGVVVSFPKQRYPPMIVSTA